jgi:hypothetical protein
MNRIIIGLHNLSLKKAVVSVFALSLVLAIPLITLLLTNETTIFTGASESDRPTQEIVDESKIPYPKEPPQVIHVTKFYGRPGDSVLIYGENFGQAQKESAVFIGNTKVEKPDVLYWSDTEIEIALPDAPGTQKLSVNVNGNQSTWFGRVNIYTQLTENVLFIDESESLIRSPNSNYDIKVYSINGNVNVFGAGEVEQEARNIPLDLTDSNILYVELSTRGRILPFKVDTF